MEVVLIRKLLPCCDVSNSGDEDSPFHLFGFAIWVAGVVDKHRRSEAVYHRVLFATTEEVGDQAIFVPLIRFILAVVRPVVFADLLA